MPRRCARNIDMTHGLVMSEAVMMGLGRYIGREYAHDLVYDICREAVKQERPLARPAGRAPGDQQAPGPRRACASCAIRRTTSASRASWSTGCSPRCADQGAIQALNPGSFHGACPRRALPLRVTEHRQIVGADLRAPADHQVGEQAPRATGHGPAERAVTGVQEQVLARRGADDRRAVRRRRTQAGPELAAARSPPRGTGR